MGKKWECYRLGSEAVDVELGDWVTLVTTQVFRVSALDNSRGVSVCWDNWESIGMKHLVPVCSVS